jgi:hypothetical protein
MPNLRWLPELDSESLSEKDSESEKPGGGARTATSALSFMLRLLTC